MAGILVVVLALVAALVLVVVTAAVVVYQRHAGHSTVQSGAAASATPTGQARAAQARRSAAAAELARIRARQQASDTRDEIATNGGWQVWDPGSVYFVLIDGTCPASAAACAFVEVLPLDGCPSGLTVEGALLDGTTVVSTASDELGPLGEGELGVAGLEFPEGSEQDDVSITRIDCS